MRVAPTVGQELEELAAAVALYDPENPDDRAAARVIAQARDLLASVKDVRQAEGAGAILALWTELKAVTAAEEPSVETVRAALEVAQRIHRLLSERAARPA